MSSAGGVSVVVNRVSQADRPALTDRLMKLEVQPHSQYLQKPKPAQIQIKPMARVGSPNREKKERRIAVPPMKDQNSLKLGKDVDIRYLNKIRQKIRDSYGGNGCSQNLCPSMQQRLHQHIQQHHSSTFKTLNYNQDQQNHNVLISQVSNEPASKPCSTITMPHRNDTQVVQTDFKTDFLRKSFENVYVDVTQVTDFNTTTSIPLKKSETREVLPKRNLYKHMLSSAIDDWLNDIPICPDLNNIAEKQKEVTVKKLLDNICDLFGETNDVVYEDKVKMGIDNCLQSLPVWYPPEEYDLGPFKESLKVSLWRSIKQIRGKFLCKYTSQDHEQEKKCVNANQAELRFFMNGHESDVEKELIDWLNGMKLKNRMNGKPVHKKEVLHLFLNRLAPFLSQPMNTTNYKLILKAEIVDILSELPVCLNCPINRNLHIYRFAEDLATKLIILQTKYRIENEQSRAIPANDKLYTGTNVASKDTPDANLKNAVMNIVSDCIKGTDLDRRNEIKMEITHIITDSIDALKDGEIDVSDEIFTYLYGFCGTTDIQASNISHAIVQEVKKLFVEDHENESPSDNLLKPRLSGVLAVYSSKTSATQYPVTSTPKKKRSKSDIDKLNPEEKAYVNEVSNLIRSWMETLPKQFNDKEFKETMVFDLAGHIMDDAKLDQLLTPFTEEQKMNSLLRYVNRWLLKFDVYDDLNDAKSEVASLVSKLLDIPVPQMTRPQHGNRQAMDNMQYTEANPTDYVYAPNIADALEYEISTWMNEQPSDIYTTNDKSELKKMVHDLAQRLKSPLEDSKHNEVTKEINNWMKKVVKSDQMKNIGNLADSLKSRIDKVSQQATSNAYGEQRRVDREDKNVSCCKSEDRITISQHCVGSSESDVDKTLREFIGKYIQHNYEVDDSMARAAFSHLLKLEFQRLSPPTRKEVYDNFAQSASHAKQLSPERLGLELQFIKDISDWLKNIPIESSFNRPGNKERIEFVNSLAKEIVDIENQRFKNPVAMDYDMYIASIIKQYLKQLPVLPQHQCNADFMVEELMGKIAASRRMLPCCPKAVSKLGIPKNIRENMSEFIEQYIHENGKEIADDEVKLEAWSARLMKEMKKIVNEASDPSTLYKSSVYNKLNEAPLPPDESVRQFNLKLDYVKEISDWIKNLPLLPLPNNSDAQENRVKMISELAEKMLERHNSKTANPSNEQTDTDFVEYVTQWISQLPMDLRKQIDYLVVTQQLMNRMDRLNQPKKEMDGIDGDIIKMTSNRNVRGSKSSKTSIKSRNRNSKTSRSSFCGDQNAGDLVVEAIEKWANSLPIKDKDGIDSKLMKDNIARRMYQKVGELNVDPRVFNDDVLYRDMLSDEIDTQLENIPRGSELLKNRDKIKTGLIDSVIDAKRIMKQTSAADDYKQKLENTIEASIPNPVQPKHTQDPGFEIYKNRLAEMFILENFDHGNDAVKMKYEKRIRSEVDKYFQSAQNKNLIPLDKDQIYNELYSALFKVPIPNETSIIEEVEEVKTRCEIYLWFEELPLREPTGLGELLEWDKILATLAKRIGEIERSDCSPEEKIQKEITKWLVKLPIVSCATHRINEFAEKLQNILRATAESRKCVKPAPIISKTSLKGKKDRSKSRLSMSQNAGPSREGKHWMSPPTSPIQRLPCCQGLPSKKPADIILDIVENWCENLPLSASTPIDEENNKQTRENLVTKIIIKISELNISPLIFNDDLIYDDLLDDELEKLFVDLPVCCEFQKIKESMKDELKAAIRSVKPLIKEEKARHEYKQELNQTVGSVLGEPSNSSEEVIALFNKIREEIVESFVEYNYNKENDEGKQFYKMKVHDAVLNYFGKVMEKVDLNNSTELLMKRNELLCELAKIPIPSNTVLKEEVQEIRMKNEVKEFFNGIGLSEGSEEKMSVTSQIKTSLAKRLHDIEKSGHNCSNEQKMKIEISRCLKKLTKDVNQDTIEDFVAKLKKNEALRKAPPPKKGNCVCPSEAKCCDFSSYEAQDMSLFSVSPYNSGQNHYNNMSQNRMSLTMSPAEPCCEAMRNQGPSSCCQESFRSNGSMPGISPAGQPSFGNGGQWMTLTSNTGQDFPPAPCQVMAQGHQTGRTSQQMVTNHQIRDISQTGKNSSQQIGKQAWNIQRNINDSTANYTGFASGMPCCSSQIHNSQVHGSDRKMSGQYLTQPIHSISRHALPQTPQFPSSSEHSLPTRMSANIQNSLNFRQSGQSRQNVQVRQNDFPRRQHDVQADSNDDMCICGGPKKKGRKRRPLCYIPMREYCEECDEFSPVLCAMAYPECFYY